MDRDWIGSLVFLLGRYLTFIHHRSLGAGAFAAGGPAEVVKVCLRATWRMFWFCFGVLEDGVLGWPENRRFIFQSSLFQPLRNLGEFACRCLGGSDISWAIRRDTLPDEPFPPAVPRWGKWRQIELTNLDKFQTPKHMKNSKQSVAGKGNKSAMPAIIAATVSAALSGNAVANEKTQELADQLNLLLESSRGVGAVTPMSPVSSVRSSIQNAGSRIAGGTGKAISVKSKRMAPGTPGAPGADGVAPGADGGAGTDGGTGGAGLVIGNGSVTSINGPVSGGVGGAGGAGGDGAQGATGSTGAPLPTAATGAAGTDGAVGAAAAPAGPAAVAGADGADGTAGTDGVAGTAGAAGSDTAASPGEGPAGVDGPPAPPAPPTPPTPPDAAQGTPGVDGVDAVGPTAPGADGTDGADGVDGPGPGGAGEDGEDGAIDAQGGNHGSVGR